MDSGIVLRWGMQKPKPKSELARTLAERAQTGRARMYLWLKDNFDDIDRARTDLHSTWDDIAKAAEAAGQKNARGGAPQAEAIRKAFVRLKAEMQAAGKEPGAKVVEATVERRQSHVRPPAPRIRSTEDPPVSSIGVAEPEFVPPSRFNPKPAQMRSRLPLTPTKDES